MISVEDIKAIATEVADEYGRFPKRLIEDARSEANIAESEQGRYILELLQNADDAQVKEPYSDSTKIGEAKAVFVVTEKYLYCANGGYEISKEGLSSICRAFLSPKRKNAPVIGFKGVGFKSVLALTEQPEIFWRNGGVSFSRESSYKYFNTITPNSVAALSPDDVPILRCPHYIDVVSAKSKDHILGMLLTNSATVFRFLLTSETTRKNVMARLSEVKASTVLFLNNLKTIEMNVEGKLKTYKISKEDSEAVIEKHVKYETAKTNIQDGENGSNWVIISGTYKLTSDVKGKLSPAWKDTDFVKISYAVAIDELGKPTPCTEYPLLHVFFPTQERIPFRILMHGTFKTNVDRRLLTQDDALNDYAITKSIELLRDKVLPLLSKQLDDPGRIIDFLQPPEDLNLTITEGKIWSGLRETLRKHKFVPNRRNNASLCPKNLSLIPVARNAAAFKSLVKGQLADKFCHDSIDMKEDRRNTLRRLGSNVLEITSLPKLFEENFLNETKWIAGLYAVFDDLLEYLGSTNPAEKANLVRETKKRKLLLLSSGERVDAESIKEKGAIFFPPTVDVPPPPKGLNLRFLHREVMTEYLKMVSKTARQTFFVRDLEIEEYAAIPVITKTVIPVIKEFWQKWPHSKVFKPEQVLDFLHALLGENLPNDPRIRALGHMPIPVKGEAQYAQAYDTYASKEWVGNDDLESIFGSACQFLAYNKRMSKRGRKEEMKRLYKWLGVAWLPRVSPQFKTYEEDRWRSCQWIGHSCFGSPHSKLPNWEEYCQKVWEECENLKGENPLRAYVVKLRTSWVMESFEKIVADPAKAKKLLSVIANNWDAHYARYAKCKIAWRGRHQDFKLSEITSYFFWQLTNRAWIPTSRFKMWGLRRPSDLLMRTDSIYRDLGDLVPYVNVRTETERVFLTRLGVKINIDDLAAKDWWRIVLDIPRLLKPDARAIRPLYRRLMQVKGIEKESKHRDNFMFNGQLLSQVNGEWQFVDRDEVWYVESEEFRKLFGNQLPIFAIRHEERRGAAIGRTFEINVLGEQLEPTIEIGERDSSASDILNSFLDRIKPYLMARIYAQRPSRAKEDASSLRRLKVEVVKSLKVSYSLTLDERTIEAQSDKRTYLDKKNNIIYIDAGGFQLKNLQTIEEDEKLASELGVQIAFRLGIDLANDFMLLIKSNDELKCEILSRANISKEEIMGWVDLLKPGSGLEPPTVESIEPLPQPGFQGSAQPTSGTAPQQGYSLGPPQTRTKPLELWTPAELGFEEPFEIAPTLGKAHGSGSGGKTGTSHPGYITDQDERTRVDQAGVALVREYEKFRHKKEHSCSPKVESKEKEDCGYDILSACDREVRHIEVKSSKGNIQVVELTAPEWDAARDAKDTKRHFLYRMRFLDKARGREPEIVIIRNPYSVLIGEPTRFKVRLNRLKGKMKIVPLKRSDEKAK